MAAENHVTELLPAYAIGCLDQDEVALVAQHLATCAVCRAEWRAHQAVAAQLALAAPDAAPSPDLKRRLMARVQPSRPAVPPAEESWRQRLAQRLQPAWPVLGLAALLVIAVLTVSNILLWQQLNAPQPTPQALRTIHLVGTDAAPDALATIVVSADGRNGVLAVDGLPSLDAQHQYQLWLINSAGQRTSGAIFSVDEEGYGTATIEAPQPLLTYPAFGVTVEPFGGSPGPTGAKVLGGEV